MMRRFNVGWFGYPFMVAATLLLLLTAVGRPAIGESHGDQTISGEVFAEQYDGSGEVTAVSIFDDNWGTVLVSPEGKGRELLAHVGAIVEAMGVVDESEEGDYTLTISSYRIIEDNAPDTESPDEGE